VQTNANSAQPVSSQVALQTTPKRIAAFFYGSFIRREVMAQGGFHPHNVDIAKLSGFDIDFDPHANIFRSEQHAICGFWYIPPTRTCKDFIQWMAWASFCLKQYL
jgi:hypothetical protein